MDILNRILERVSRELDIYLEVMASGITWVLMLTRSMAGENDVE